MLSRYRYEAQLRKYFEEGSVDWSEILIDTPIYVRETDTGPWRRRYFAEYKDGRIYAFSEGTTSWSNEPRSLTYWPYAELAEIL